jgi:hypothetical protein
VEPELTGEHRRQIGAGFGTGGVGMRAPSLQVADVPQANSAFPLLLSHEHDIRGARHVGGLVECTI